MQSCYATQDEEEPDWGEDQRQLGALQIHTRLKSCHHVTQQLEGMSEQHAGLQAWARIMAKRGYMFAIVCTTAVGSASAMNEQAGRERGC